MNDIHCAVHGAAHAAGEPNNSAEAVADGRDAMKRTLHARAIIRVEGADAFGDVVNFCACDLFFQQGHFVFNKTRSWYAAKVNHDLEQFFAVVRFFHRVTNIGWKDFEQGFQVVCNSMLSHS